MRTVVAILLGAGLLAAQPPRSVAARTVSDAPVQQQPGTVPRAAMQAVEKNIDARLFAEPTDLMGNTRGIYLPGFGVVLSAEVALIKLRGPSPFHLTITPEERDKAHALKLEALPKLKETMKAALISAAAELRGVPLGEKLVIGVNLFNWNWENTTGLPTQIVMQDTRQHLVTHLDAIQVQEF